MEMAEISQILGREAGSGVPELKFSSIPGDLFDSEFAIDNGVDIVFHFFRKQGTSQHFWLHTFSEIVSKHAMVFFNEKFPTLRMAHSSELDSWWLRADGVGATGLPEVKAKSFISEISRQLAAAPG